MATKVSNVDVLKQAAPKSNSHQAWINNPNSGLGGMGNYVNTQQEKYNQAVSSGNKNLISALEADMNRVGYQLNTSAAKAPDNGHQAWINNPNSGQGGMGTYVSGQQDKMNQAVLSGDKDMIARLQADMARVGYDLNVPQLGGGGSGDIHIGYGGATFTPPPLPTMRSGQSMADLLGIKRDYNDILSKYTTAVDKKYANLDTEFGRTQDMYYDTVANNADVLMGAMRRGDREAVQTGVAGGTQSAQDLSALLGVSAEAALGATELSQGRSDLVNERETEMANVTKDALKYYNDLGIQVGQLSASELNALTQAYAAQVATQGGIYNTDVLAKVEKDRIDSQENIATSDRISRENIAGWGNATNVEIAKQTGMSQLEVEQARGEWNKAVAQTSASAIKNSGSGGSYASYGGQPIASGSKEDLNMQLRVESIFSMMSKYEKDATPEGRRMYEALSREMADLLNMDYTEITKSLAQKGSERPGAPVNEGVYTKPIAGKPLTNDEIIREGLKGMKDFSGRK